MRTDLHRLDLVLALERDPGLDEVLGEYATGGEVFVILFELVDDRRQRGRGLRDALGLPELSGQRNSRRLAFGLLPVIGIRTQALRLRWL